MTVANLKETQSKSPEIIDLDIEVPDNKISYYLLSNFLVFNFWFLVESSIA